jgi:hypothetical protein
LSAIIGSLPLNRQDTEKIAFHHQADARREGFAHDTTFGANGLIKQILQLFKVAAARRRHGPVVIQQLFNRGGLRRRMPGAGEHRERFLKQFLKAEFMIVRAGIIGIDGEIQLPWRSSLIIASSWPSMIRTFTSGCC